MKNKLSLLLLLFIVCILSISAVSAADNATNKDVISTDNNKCDNLETNIHKDVLTSKENCELNLEQNNNDELKDAGVLNFNDLNVAINGNSNSTIYLSNNYKYDNDSDSNFKDGININRNLIVYGNGVTIDGNSMVRIFKVADDVTAGFHNITFVNANSTDNGGGAIRYGNAYDCTFISNFALDGGAIIYGNAYNCTFIGNTADFDGGAISYGDAYNCTFTNNAADFDGGAISYGNAYNCTFTNNTAENGGAIDYGNATNCNFDANYAKKNGGAMDGGNAYNCIFTNNSAKDKGGAIDSGNAYNCTFMGNTAKDGGAMFKGTVCLYILNEDSLKDTKVIHPKINVLNYTSTYNSGEKLKFNLTANDMVFDGFKTNISIYKNGSLVKTAIGLSGEGWIVDVGLGEYTAVLSLTDFPEEESSNANINVSIGNTIIDIIPVINAKVGQEVTINYTTNSNGTVTIKVGGQKINGTKFTPNKEGSYNVTIEVAGNDYYTAASNQTIFKVKKTTTVVAISPITNVVAGQEVTINYTTNSNGTVTIKVGGLPINGTKFTPTKASTYIVSVEVAGNDYYTAASNQTTFKAEKLVSKIIVSPVNTTYNVGKYLIITLKDDNGKPINSALVTVNLTNSKKYKTDSEGKIKINVATLTPKTYTAKITYVESDTYKGSAASVEVTVKKATPKITAKKKTFKKSVKTKKYTIILKDNTGKVMKKVKVSLKVKGKTYNATTNSKGKATFKKSVKIKKYSIVLKNNLGKAIKNAKVTIKIGKKTFNAKTNSKGKATFKIKLTKKGTFKAKVKFAGNTYYNAVTKTVKIKIK